MIKFISSMGFLTFFLLPSAIYMINMIYQSGLVGVSSTVVGLMWISSVFFAFKRLSIFSIFVLGFLLCLVWAISSSSVPFSDFSTFYNQSSRLAEGDFSSIIDSKSAPTVAYYSFYFYLLGDSLVTSYIGSSLAWCAGGLLIYKALKLFGFSDKRAKLVYAALVFYPSFIFYSPVISSEAVYYLISALCLFAFARLSRFPNIVNGCFLGVFLGLLFLTRSIGIVLIIAFFIITSGFFRCQINARDVFGGISLRKVLIVFVSFFFILFAHGSFSYTNGGGFYFTSSPWGSYNLLAGTNRESNGGYNLEDLKLAGYVGEEKVTHEEASSKAVEIAIDRILKSPVDFLEFSLTDKISRLWSQEFAYHWAVAKSPIRDDVDNKYKEFVISLVSGAHALISIVFIISIIHGIRNSNGYLFFVITPIYGYALLHLVVEVQGRYQMTMTPFLIGVSANYIYNIFESYAHLCVKRFNTCPPLSS